MSQALKALLILAWMTTLASSFHARAAEGNVEQTQETGAKYLEVGYVSTPQHVVNLMLELANVKKTDLLYDLGCGDGRIVVSAARKYGCKAVGVDIDPERVSEARANVKAANLEHLVTIEQADIFELDLSKADVVTLYLLRRLNVRLIPQLEMMKPGSRVVSHDFDMPGVKPDVEVTCSSRLHGTLDKIYLWEVPLNKVAITDVDLTQRGPLSAVKTYASQYTSQRVLLVLVISTLGIAAFLWLLRRRLGVIKFKVTIDRP